MSLQTRIDALITRIGDQFKAERTSMFQVACTGTTPLTTTGAYVTMLGATFWATPTVGASNPDFTWNGLLGSLTVEKAGTLEIDAKVTGHLTAANRCELCLQLSLNGSPLVEDRQYAMRNSTQDSGSASINGFLLPVAVDDVLTLQVRDIGTAAFIGDSEVAGLTYLSAKLYP